MIIRRRHTKEFVTLENRLVRDKRLSLDEHGMLHYLLSLPDDWEVSRANCARFWNIGREKAARIFRSLQKFGWAQVERMHAEDGTFLGVRWIITDEPGEEVSDAALDQQIDGDDEPEKPAAEGPGADHDTGNPCDGLTVVRLNRSTANPYHGDYIDSTKTESYENRIPQNGARENLEKVEEKPVPAFSDLATQWPAKHILSRIAAEQAWLRLTRLAKRDANDVVGRYLADCDQTGRKVCDLTTYLKEARFERFASLAPRAVTFHAKPNTPQWCRWLDYLKTSGQSTKFMEIQAAKGIGWTVPQEWPPAMPPRPDPVPSADATGPPETLMTEQDEADFCK
jgi:hypothetical protein